MSRIKEDADTGWGPEVGELHQRESLAAQMGGTENLERQSAAGRLNVRQRINLLLDKDSFHEVGATVGTPTYEGKRLVKLLPSNFIMGTGRISGRRVVVGGDDFTIRGGAADAAIGQKAAYSEKMALDLRLPMVRLVEGTGGGGSVKSLEMMAIDRVSRRKSLDTTDSLGIRRENSRASTKRRFPSSTNRRKNDEDESRRKSHRYGHLWDTRI